MRASVMCVALLVSVNLHTAHADSHNSNDSSSNNEDSPPSCDTEGPKELSPSASLPPSPGPATAAELGSRFSRIRQRAYDTLGHVYETTRPVRDGIYRYAYNTAGQVYDSTYPVREKLHSHAYNTAGLAYDTGRSKRKELQRSKTVKFGGIAWKVLKPLKLIGISREQQIKILVDSVSKELVEHIPVYTKIQPVEISSTLKYVCGAKGLMRDLTTLKRINTEVETRDDQSSRIYIDYTFTDLHFNYTKFYINVLQSKLRAQGMLDIKFKSNVVRITLQVPKLSEIVTNIALKRCIVHVINFEVIELVFDDSVFDSFANDNRGKFLDKRISQYLKNKPEMLRLKYEQRTLVEIHRALRARDHWICKDKGFTDLVKSKGGSLEHPVVSDRFKKNCGEDFYIEPYKKPPVEDDTS